jgi:hypothetical protein
MMTPREITRAIIRDVAIRHLAGPADILSRRHPRQLLAARIEIAERLAARGYNGVQIAAAMNRDYTTVYFYLGRTARKPSPRTLATVAKRPQIDHNLMVYGPPNPTQKTAGLH